VPSAVPLRVSISTVGERAEAKPSVTLTLFDLATGAGPVLQCIGHWF